MEWKKSVSDVVNIEDDVADPVLEEENKQQLALLNRPLINDDNEDNEDNRVTLPQTNELAHTKAGIYTADSIATAFLKIGFAPRNQHKEHLVIGNELYVLFKVLSSQPITHN